MTRTEAIALGLTRYRGKVCVKHPAFAGERYVNGHCVECHRMRQRELSRRPEVRAWKNARMRTPEGRAKRRERQRTSEVWKANAKAYEAAKRARERNTIVGDTREINRAFKALSRKAKRLGLTVDHVIPLSPCRVCGEQGTHSPDNWALLTLEANSAKGNRCDTCIMRPVVPPVARNPRNVLIRMSSPAACPTARPRKRAAA